MGLIRHRIAAEYVDLAEKDNSQLSCGESGWIDSIGVECVDNVLINVIGEE
ncbi:hypothetical protein ACJIZ3_006133 [Penstemon smallii]|uniref:Uncharacterized protein n=1 Tax=Penstemon smallii TaxID=265156 RepID=A0ABD3S7A2_9LAMI